MNKEIAKKAFESAENELTDKAVEKLKLVIKSTLERVRSIEESIDKLQEEKKILKLDLEDLKEGRLDRIEERQLNDKKSKDVSAVEVVKEIHHHHHYEWWNQPYVIKVKPVKWYDNIVYSDSIGDPVFALGCSTTELSNGTSVSFTATGSLSKNNAVGTYHLTNDDVVHFR